MYLLKQWSIQLLRSLSNLSLIFVCVCVSVYLPENEDLVPTSYIPDSGRATKRGRPRIGEIVQMVANSTCIHMRMC